MKTVKAKVATIVSEHQVALNAGSARGVAKDDEVLLYRSIQVDDPDSMEKLGSVRIVKLRLKVNHVQEKLCVARVTSRVTPAGKSTVSAALTMSGSFVRVKEAGTYGSMRSDEISVAIGEEVEILVADADETDETESDDLPF